MNKKIFKDIKIKYFTDAIEKIKTISKGDWIDLRAAEKVEMKSGEFKLIPLGVAMQLPKGYEAHVCPRPFTVKNFGITQTNSIIITDNSYCGDNDQWFFPAYALRDTVINVNDPICQFSIMESQPAAVDFIVVETLGNEDRGGIGSTGVSRYTQENKTEEVTGFDYESLKSKLNPEDNIAAQKTDELVETCEKLIISMCQQIAQEDLSENQKHIIRISLRWLYGRYFDSYNEETGKYDITKLPDFNALCSTIGKNSGYDAYDLYYSLKNSKA